LLRTAYFDLLDDGSARVLLQLAAGGKATVIATARSASAVGTVERLWRDGHCERIELTGLSEDGVGELVEMVLEGPADIGVGPALASRSQGNPLLLRELIQQALARSVLEHRLLLRPGAAYEEHARAFAALWDARPATLPQ